MYQRIKQLADEALALQNKGAMEKALREISALCDEGMKPAPDIAMDAEQFEAAELAQHQDRNVAQSNPLVAPAEYAANTATALAYEYVTYGTSTFPGGDPPELKAALERSMEPVTKSQAKRVKAQKGGA